MLSGALDDLSLSDGAAFPESTLVRGSVAPHRLNRRNWQLRPERGVDRACRQHAASGAAQVLTATLSDNTSVMLVGKYSNGPLKLFAGYEFIRYALPSNPFAPGTGFSDIAGDFVCAGCAAFNNTNINNTAFNAGDKLFHVFWSGVKYTVMTNLDVISAYYHYGQPAFGAPVNCADASAFPNCHGTFDAVSFAVDWQSSIATRSIPRSGSAFASERPISRARRAAPSRVPSLLLSARNVPLHLRRTVFSSASPLCFAVI